MSAVRTLKVVLLLNVLAACSQKSTGPYRVGVLRQTGPHCQYAIQATDLKTLQSLDEMRGGIGHVVRHPLNVDSTPEILDQRQGFERVPVQFEKSGDAYYPSDFTSLYVSSLYYAIETGYLLHASLDPVADMSKRVPDFGDTFLVYDVRRSFGRVGKVPEVHDNAEYLPHEVGPDSAKRGILNYFFAYPTDTVTEVPLGMNAGIMVHEYSHMVFHYLFFEQANSANLSTGSEKPTQNTISALDEGQADG